MRTRLAALAVIAALALAGCGGADPQDVTADGPATPIPAETALAPVKESPTPEATTEPDPAETSPYGEAVMNERGNLVKAIGQLAGVVNEAGETLVDLTITAIEPNFVCTAEYADAPVNGQFIAITFDITTTAALAAESSPSWYMSEYDIKVIGPDGTRENDSTGNAYMCLNDGERLPSDIGPGEHVVGKLVLDSAYPTGSLVVDSQTGGGGWEWGY